ncbi:MAG: 2-oxo acid dehydrogenase subunit E2 [Bacteroidales bacterium]|nr:2-oxo acid dehydrogenase subunit E2 [Bacteroidales bacterium]
MSEYRVIMPKMGESVQEATITKWFVKEGDSVKEDDVLFEIATEKVDSEIPSPVDGTVVKILFETGAVVPVGDLVAIISVGSEGASEDKIKTTKNVDLPVIEVATVKSNHVGSEIPVKFFSPLVKSMAKKENIGIHELNQLEGSGINGRVQKKDVLEYIASRGHKENKNLKNTITSTVEDPVVKKTAIAVGGSDRVVEMDRVRKIIADHMINSVRVAPHVTNVVEADVTNLVLWRNKVKDEFFKKYNEKLTYMPVFIEAVASALREFPMINSSVDGDKIILRGKVNIGIAVAKPDGNLIVPVISDADQKNLIGLTSALNDLANRARINKLSPDEISGGTFSITNFGSFRNLFGTPIINQPQVAILATGNIEKKPAVMETPTGDAIVVRHIMYLSLTYDHRVIDGALGGAFLRRVADLLEAFDSNRLI